MDAKKAGNLLFIVGETKNELGGSHYYKVNDLLYVDEEDIPYQLGQHNRTSYYFPLLGGAPAVPQTLESKGRFRKLGGALESKEMTIYFEDDQEFYDSYSYSPKGASYRIKQRFDNLKRRIQRMEDIVTQREYDWDAKMKE